MADPNLSSFIWSVADLLRGDYKQSEYGKVILPFTVLRWLDCVLESAKDAVLAEKATREKPGVNSESFLLRRAEFGREREGIDLSKVVLTHHDLKDRGVQGMPLHVGEKSLLPPITEAGSGSVQEKEKALLAVSIAKVNDLFEGELSDQDKLVYVNNVIKGKLLESEKLVQQAMGNEKAQFANSPDLNPEMMNAIMGALDAHTAMSTQALNSIRVQNGLRDILLNHAGLWEALRAKGALGSKGAS